MNFRKNKLFWMYILILITFLILNIFLSKLILFFGGNPYVDLTIYQSKSMRRILTPSMLMTINIFILILLNYAMYMIKIIEQKNIKNKNQFLIIKEQFKKRIMIINAILVPIIIYNYWWIITKAFFGGE